jgi:hypothetical protein
VLHGGEVSLQYLVDPTGVHWQRDEGGVGPVLAQASGGGPAALAPTPR